MDADLVGDDRRVPSGNVAEWTAVNEGRCAFEGLHEIRLDGLFEDDSHRAGHAELLGGDRGASLVVPDDDPAHPDP